MCNDTMYNVFLNLNKNCKLYFYLLETRYKNNTEWY